MTMQKRKLDNKTLDDIGKKLLASSRLTEAEIDRIAAASSFEGVLRRADILETAVGQKRGLAGFLFTHRAIAGASFAAIVCISAFALLQQNRASLVSNTINTPNTPVERPDEARPATPQVEYVKGFTSGRADLPSDVAAETPTVQNAVQRESRRPQPRVERASYSQNNETQFVAVTHMGDGGESARGGRVVRVDVPRSTLFAMGFDVSLENDSPTVKADLLIGPDGVTRGVRLVE